MRHGYEVLTKSSDVFWYWIVGALASVLFIATIIQFNRMTVLRNRMRESWSDVGVELQRRHVLIPQLVGVTKGAAQHETSVLAALTKARATWSRREAMAGESRAESELTQHLQRLIAVAEAHPRLRVNENFLQLQNELAITEDRIAASRRFYNANVRDYHDKIRTFPGNLFAAAFGFRRAQFFQRSAG